jgi:hypothetical protein
MLNPLSPLDLKANDVFAITFKDPKGLKRYGHSALCIGMYCYELTSYSNGIVCFNKDEYLLNCNQRLAQGKTPHIIIHQLKASLIEMQKLLEGVASTLQHAKQWDWKRQFVCSTFVINVLNYATKESEEPISRQSPFHLASWFCSTPAKAAKLIEDSGRVLHKSVYSPETFIPL